MLLTQHTVCYKKKRLPPPTCLYFWYLFRIFHYDSEELVIKIGENTEIVYLKHRDIFKFYLVFESYLVPQTCSDIQRVPVS